MKFVRLCLLFNVPRFPYLVDILVFDHQRIYECSGLIDVVLLYYLSISFLTQLVDIFRRLTVVNCSAEGFGLTGYILYLTIQILAHENTIFKENRIDRLDR